MATRLENLAEALTAAAPDAFRSLVTDRGEKLMRSIPNRARS
jgi:hypothetical protein